MPPPLMPKGTAVWLVENTHLTFEQIGAFCGMHALEVQGIADGEVAQGIKALDPTANGQLTWEEINRASADPKVRLEMRRLEVPLLAKRAKGPCYTPVSKRQDKPDALAFLLRHYPELSDAQVCKLLGTTKPTIAAVRDRTHWNSRNIRPRDPVILGLCRQVDLDDAIAKARAAGRKRAPEPTVDAPAEKEAPRSNIPAWMAGMTLKRGGETR
ncbi:MAG: DUF1013 domain-containing protein [Alphaproteobacteria bacterium]|nr:DUF1013 domain-containing protein [Alphaproteobacteria bacterium]